MYFGNQIVSKMRIFAALGKGGTLPGIDQIDQIDQNLQTGVPWSINNQVWSILEIEIDHNISFPIYGLVAVVNLVNLGRYTPPYKRKTAQIVVNCVVNSLFLGKKELTTNEESTTYRGWFFPLFPKSSKSFVFNPTLQPKDLSPIGQLFP